MLMLVHFKQVECNRKFFRRGEKYEEKDLFNALVVHLCSHGIYGMFQAARVIVRVFDTAALRYACGRILRRGAKR